MTPHRHCDEDPDECSFERLWNDYQEARRQVKAWRARALQAERALQARQAA